jgi:hypothetical protein
LKRLYKFKLSIISERIAMMSLENKIPSYFSTGSHPKVVFKMGDSYFTICVPTWAHWWDEADSGFRARTDSELVMFKNSHQQNVDEAYKKGFRAYRAFSRYVHVPSFPAVWSAVLLVLSIVDDFSFMTITNNVDFLMRRFRWSSTTNVDFLTRPNPIKTVCFVLAGAHRIRIR